MATPLTTTLHMHLLGGFRRCFDDFIVLLEF